MNNKVQLEYPMAVGSTHPQGIPPKYPIDAKELIADGTLFRGVVSKDGTWLIEPAAGWTVERLDVGKYKVSHTLGWNSITLSVNLLVQPGHIQIIEHHPLYCIVLCGIDQVPTDLAWSLVIARVLSLSA